MLRPPGRRRQRAAARRQQRSRATRRRTVASQVRSAGAESQVRAFAPSPCSATPPPTRAEDAARANQLGILAAKARRHRAARLAAAPPGALSLDDVGHLLWALSVSPPGGAEVASQRAALVLPLLLHLLWLRLAGAHAPKWALHAGYAALQATRRSHPEGANPVRGPGPRRCGRVRWGGVRRGVRNRCCVVHSQLLTPKCSAAGCGRACGGGVARGGARRAAAALHRPARGRVAATADALRARAMYFSGGRRRSVRGGGAGGGAHPQTDDTLKLMTRLRTLPFRPERFSLVIPQTFPPGCRHIGILAGRALDCAARAQP